MARSRSQPMPRSYKLKYSRENTQEDLMRKLNTSEEKLLFHLMSQSQLEVSI